MRAQGRHDKHQVLRLVGAGAGSRGVLHRDHQPDGDNVLGEEDDLGTHREPHVRPVRLEDVGADVGAPERLPRLGRAHMIKLRLWRVHCRGGRVVSTAGARLGVVGTVSGARAMEVLDEGGGEQMPAFPCAQLTEQTRKEHRHQT